MDRRTHDRRSSGHSDRRKPCGISLLQNGLRGRGESSPFTIVDAGQVREQPERSGGNFVPARAAEIGAPEEKTLKEINAALRLANEHLVIATIESQMLAEESEKSNVELSHLANHDFLTNLPNRMQLDDRIIQAIAHAKRHNEEMAVLFIDLDRFKIVNDTLGHAIGDQLLQAVAQRLKSAIRSSDTVSRQGGDEFVLVLSAVNREKTLALNVEKIQELVTSPYTIGGHDLLIGATIGISIFPQDGEDPEALMRNADDAMYYAKDNGRNRYQFFNPGIRALAMERRRVNASQHQMPDQQLALPFLSSTN